MKINKICVNILQNLSIQQCSTVLANGNVAYSEVKTFLHKDPNKIEKYRTIKTQFNGSLTLTENHLVYSSKSS